MPDIFGRTETDYASVRAYQEADLWEQRQAALAQERPHANPVHNFDALGSGFPNGMERAEPNAQAIGFLTDNLVAIQSMVDEVLYLKYRLPDYVHLNMNIAEGATSYLVKILDRTGRGSFITNFGTDAPVANVSQRQVTHELRYAGIDALYSVEDLRNAMFTGLALDSKVIESAIDGALEHMEAVVLLGSAGDDTLPSAIDGLCNYDTGSGNVNLQTQGSNMTFSDLTGAQIRDLINDDISWVIETTKETFGTNIMDGMCVYFPTQQFNRTATRFVGDNEERSVMRAVQEDNAWTQRTGNPVMFKSVPELDGRGASNTDRMITAVKDSRVFEAGVSISPRVLQVMNKGRYTCAQVEYKFSTLFMKRPTTIRYRDAV